MEEMELVDGEDVFAECDKKVIRNGEASAPYYYIHLKKSVFIGHSSISSLSY